MKVFVSMRLEIVRLTYWSQTILMVDGFKSLTKKRRKKTSGTQIIPGVNLSVSWKKLLGITRLRRWFTNKTGIPTTEAGIERKIGQWLIGLVTGGNKQEVKKKKNFADIQVEKQPDEKASSLTIEEKEGVNS